MTFKITVLCGLLLCGILSVDSEDCGKCMVGNYVKCVNTSSYQFCKGPSTALTDVSGVHNCDTGKVCTNSANICEPADKIVTPTENVCKIGACAVPACAAAGELHCTGPSKYVFCTSLTTKVPQSCPDGEYCSEKLYTTFEKICAKQSVLEELDIKFACESDVAAPTVPTGLADKCWAAKDDAPGVTSFLIANPTDCKTYIYCEWSDNQLVGLQMNCKSGSHFDITLKKCVAGSC